ncbi:MAG: hypothetical protein Q3965_06365 [Rothia sp. (in: high G+C Gram-positive bacteria)]|nr:hypothetical protein [Rothia sp. (in: high G+C Gram-positive bacteria)]
MAEHSRNHSDNHKDGYKKNKDGASSRGKRSFGNRSNRDGHAGRNYSNSRDTRERNYENREERVDERDYQGGFGKRRNNDRTDRNNNRGDRSTFAGNRKDRAANDRKGKGFTRDNRGVARGPQKDKDFSREKTQNPAGGYRPSKSAPEIDTDVTGKELENWTLRALRQLESQNAETVAKHLVMVGRYLELDPAFALEHALAASKRAGRIGLVREVVGIAAYAAEDFELALRELRTHRRISGSNEHLALLVDCERALGRIEKALTLAEEAKGEDVAPAVRSEVAIVVSGIHQDAGNTKKALAALQIPELNPKRGFDYSPRLFSTYAELLKADGQTAEARRWARLALVTEAALGQGAFADPEIFDIFTEEDLFEAEEPAVDAEAILEQENAETAEVAEATEEMSVEAEVAELLGETTDTTSGIDSKEETATQLEEGEHRA